MPLSISVSHIPTPPAPLISQCAELMAGAKVGHIRSPRGTSCPSVRSCSASAYGALLLHLFAFFRHRCFQAHAVRLCCYLGTVTRESNASSSRCRAIASGLVLSFCTNTGVWRLWVKILQVFLEFLRYHMCPWSSKAADIFRGSHIDQRRKAAEISSLTSCTDLPSSNLKRNQSGIVIQN